MILLDSNIIIYLRDPTRGPEIAARLGDARLATCNVVVSEVLGFKGLQVDDANYFENLFAAMKNLPFDERVTREVIALRRKYTMQLPDAIVAATATAYEAELWTHNSDDFKKVAGLRLFDPLES